MSSDNKIGSAEERRRQARIDAGRAESLDWLEQINRQIKEKEEKEKREQRQKQQQG